MYLKESSFFGRFSIRHGCLAACIVQIILGVVLWGVLQYARPLLRVIHILTMLYFLLGAALGLYAVWKRSDLIMWLYLMQLGSCAAIVFLIVMDLLGILPIFPQASEVHRKVDISKLHRLERRPGNSISQIMKAYTLTSDPDTFPIAAASHRRIMSTSDATLLENKGALRSTTNKNFYTPSPKKVVVFLEQRTPVEAKSLSASFIAKPKPSTEGQTEEVSRDELPPEVPQLPKNMQQQVSATAKVIKHVIKFFFSGVFVTLFIFQMYCSYIVFTFVLNKCTSLDELTEQPEQFEPIVQAESSDTVFSQISTAP